MNLLSAAPPLIAFAVPCCTSASAQDSVDVLLRHRTVVSARPAASNNIQQHPTTTTPPGPLPLPPPRPRVVFVSQLQRIGYDIQLGLFRFTQGQ